MQSLYNAIEDGYFLKACISLLCVEEFKLPWIYRFVSPFKPNTQNQSQGTTDDFNVETIKFSKPLTNESFFDSTRIEDTTSSILLSNFNDLLPEDTFVAMQRPPPQKNKSKYHCPGGDLNVWAKPGVRLLCLDCNMKLLFDTNTEKNN